MLTSPNAAPASRPMRRSRWILYASLAAILSPAVSVAQLGPLPPQSSVNLGLPNGAAKLDSSGNATSLNVIANGGATTRTLGARASDRLNLLDYAPAGSQVDQSGVADASAALANAVAAANTAMAAGRFVCIYIPAGTYRIVTAPPAFALGLPGCVLGEGPQKSVINLDAAFAGDLFAWSEAWIVHTSGAHVGNLRINGAASPAAQQNALAFYDRNDNVDLHDIYVSNLQGRALYSGMTKNTPAAYMRESHFNSIRLFNDGAPGVPVVEFNSNDNNHTDDATNEISVSQLDIFGAAGPSLVIRSTSGTIRDIKFDQLRIEGLQNGTVAGDLITIGDPVLLGTVNSLIFANTELIDPYFGYAAIRTTAATAQLMPYSINFTGSIGGGLPNGQGIRIDAGRGMSFKINTMNTTDKNVVVGMAAGSTSTPQAVGMVAGGIVLDNLGFEQAWTYAINPANSAALQAPLLRVGVPSATGAPGGTTTLHGTITADAMTTPGTATMATLSLTGTMAPGLVLAAPASASGAPTFRTLATGDVAGAAPLASPALTGVPTVPTAATGATTTQIASTAFVGSAVAAVQSAAAAAQATATAAIPQSAIGVTVAPLAAGHVPAAQLLLSVALRGPGPTDDGPSGYHVGDLWNFTGRIFQALSVGAGAASWSPVIISNALPLDLAPTAAGAFGVCKVSSLYAGAAVRLTRASDSTTLDIPFKSDGCWDSGQGDAFAVGTTAYITIVYDQSGAGNNATAAVGSNAPVWGVGSINGIRSLLFNRIIVTSTCIAAANCFTATNQWMTIPASMTTHPSTTSVFFLGQARDTNNVAGVASQGPASGAHTVFTGSNPVSNVATPGMGYGGLQNTALPVRTDPTVMSWQIHNGTWNLADGNNPATIAAGASTSATAGGSLGSPDSFTASDFDALVWIFYDRAFVAGEVTKITASLERIGSVVPQGTEILVHDGDSITYGFDTLYSQPRSRQVRPLLNRAVHQYNIGYSGATIGESDPQNRISAFPAEMQQIYNLYPHATTFIVDEMIGTNDIGTASNLSTIAATAYSKMQTLCGLINGLGSNVHLIVSTVLPRGNNASASTMQAPVDALNAALRAGAASLLATINDAAADPVMGGNASTTINVNNLAYYVDGLHPTDLGQGILAVPLAASIDKFLQ